MNKLIVAFVVLFMPFAVIADEHSGKKKNKREIDLSRYCYFNDLAYSLGSIIDTASKRKLVCKLDPKSKELFWSEIKNK